MDCSLDKKSRSASSSDEEEFYDCVEETASLSVSTVASSITDTGNSTKDYTRKDYTTSGAQSPTFSRLDSHESGDSVEVRRCEDVNGDGGVKRDNSAQISTFEHPVISAQGDSEKNSSTHSNHNMIDQSGSTIVENTQKALEDGEKVSQPVDSNEQPLEEDIVQTLSELNVTDQSKGPENTKSELEDDAANMEGRDLDVGVTKSSGDNTLQDKTVTGVSESSNAGGSSEKDMDNAEDENCAKEESENEDDSLEDETTLTEAEIEERKVESRKLKDEGNQVYKNGDFTEAERLYSEGLKFCPKCLEKDRAVLYSNRSACLVKMDKTESAIEDCTRAVELHPAYLKAFLRRAQLYEKLEKYEEATKDYEEVLKLDPSIHSARAALMQLPKKIEERNEKLKAKMMSSLKDLGNLVLRPFGLSTDNFQLQQDPNSGSYNIQFNSGQQQRNGPTNGPSNGR